MNKILKFKTSSDCNLFFTSDLHLNHKLEAVWKYRGYESVEAHKAAVIDKINEVVGANDILFNLGDFTLNCEEPQFEEIIDSIKCRSIYTLWGNHNSPSWSIYKREVSNLLGSSAAEIPVDVEIYPLKYKNIIFCGNYLECIIDGQIVVMQHYPISVFNHMARNSVMVCGHSHYNFENSQAETLNKEKILDVGWDGHKKPLSFSEVMEIMNKKSLEKVDHHF